MWILITEFDNELDAIPFRTEKEAQDFLIELLDDRYGDLFEDDPPPNTYNEKLLGIWMADNLIFDTWKIKQVRAIND